MRFVLSLSISIFLAMSLPVQAGDLANGKKLSRKCSMCHGRDGLSKDPEAPNLAGMSKLYMTKQIKAYQSGEREDRRMTLIAKSLKDEHIADLAEWYSNFKVTVVAPDI